MDSSRLILFYDKCRLCLDNAGERNICDTEDLQNDIFICIGVKVSSTDNLPQKICPKCLKVVTNTKELRLLANRNDDHLRSLFPSTNDDIIKEENDDEEDFIQLFEPQTQLETSSKKKENRHSSSENEQNETTQTECLKVRTDLFKTSAKHSPVKVKTKEEYEAIRKKIKLEIETDPVVYECKICEKHFDTWKKLYLHKRMHNKNIACPLDACGKKFATKGDLEKHVRTHTGYKPYSCDICDKSFTQQGTLKAHKENVHYSYTF